MAMPAVYVDISVDARILYRHLDASLTNSIQKLQAGALDVWFADLSSIQKGRWVKIQPILSFLKGDTPQPASYTSTTGPSGKHFCHGCCANTENFFEKGVLLKQRRSVA